MAKWSRRRTKTFKGTGARSTTTITTGKGITRSSSTKLGTKRTTRSTGPNNKTKIIETYHVNGATLRKVHTQGPLNRRSVNLGGLGLDSGIVWYLILAIVVYAVLKGLFGA